MVEFKTAAGEALAISRAEKRSHRAQALPGQEAVWAGGPGRRRDPMSALGQPACAHAADTKRAAAADTKRAAGCISMPAAQVHGGSTQFKEKVRPEDSHNERQRDCIILRCCLQSCTEWPPRRSSSVRFARAIGPVPNPADAAALVRRTRYCQRPSVLAGDAICAALAKAGRTATTLRQG